MFFTSLVTCTWPMWSQVSVAKCNDMASHAQQAWLCGHNRFLRVVIVMYPRCITVIHKCRKPFSALRALAIRPVQKPRNLDGAILRGMTRVQRGARRLGSPGTNRGTEPKVTCKGHVMRNLMGVYNPLHRLRSLSCLAVPLYWIPHHVSL